MKQKETFKQWLVRTYNGKDTRIGDLAGDVTRDAAFPDSSDWDGLYEYVSRRAKSNEGAVLALMEAYVEWRDLHSGL